MHRICVVLWATVFCTIGVTYHWPLTTFASNELEIPENGCISTGPSSQGDLGTISQNKLKEGKKNKKTNTKITIQKNGTVTVCNTPVPSSMATGKITWCTSQAFGAERCQTKFKDDLEDEIENQFDRFVDEQLDPKELNKMIVMEGLKNFKDSIIINPNTGKPNITRPQIANDIPVYFQDPTGTLKPYYPGELRDPNTNRVVAVPLSQVPDTVSRLEQMLYAVANYTAENGGNPFDAVIAGTPYVLQGAERPSPLSQIQAAYGTDLGVDVYHLTPSEMTMADPKSFDRGPELAPPPPVIRGMPIPLSFAETFDKQIEDEQFERDSGSLLPYSNNPQLPFVAPPKQQRSPYFDTSIFVDSWQSTIVQPTKNFLTRIGNSLRGWFSI